MIKILSISALLLLLTGCTSDGSWGDASTPSYQTQVKLAEAATSISHSLQQLAVVDKAAHPRVKIPPPPSPDSIGMGQLASVNWTGPISKLLLKIAKASHYQLHIIGKRPSIPVIVSITATGTPLASILRDASFQAEKYTDIAIYPHRKVVELRYKNVA